MQVSPTFLLDDCGQSPPQRTLLLIGLLVALCISAGGQNPAVPATPNSISYLYVPAAYPDPLYFNPGPLDDLISEFAISPFTSELTKVAAITKPNPTYLEGVSGLLNGGPWVFVTTTLATVTAYRISDSDLPPLSARLIIRS